MNTLFKIRQNLKRKKYRKYIEEHRENIEKAFYEMVMCPEMNWTPWEELHVDLYDRVKTHDLSKYDKEEFEPYRMYYYPVDKYEKILAKKVFDEAWKHHYESNRHHWQCRTYDPDSDTMTKEQILDCLENVLDWMAMGYKFNDRPYQFYEKHKDEIKLPKIQKEYIEKVIYDGVDKKIIQRRSFN